MITSDCRVLLLIPIDPVDTHHRARQPSRMKILYLTFFESVTRNGIYETQVRQVLCEVSSKGRGQITVSHLAILPAAVVGRDEILVPFVNDRHALIAVEREYSRNGVVATIAWLPVVIPKRWKLGLPLLGLIPILSLSGLVLLYKVARERPDVIHCRSYPATLLAVLAKLVFKDVKIVFDPRGFWPEEGVVTGQWKAQSLTFRFWKRVEKFLLRRSDKVIALSASFADRITGMVKTADCQVIYASAEVGRFAQARELRDSRRKELRFEGRDVLVYCGSLPSWHDPQLIAEIFKVAGQSLHNLRLLVLTGYDRNKLETIFSAAGLRNEDFRIVAAHASDVSSYLAAADYGLVPLREITQHAMAVVADTMIGTKVAEYLAAGLPLIVNQQVGGLKSLMERYRIGIFFDRERLTAMVPGIQHMQENYGAYQRDCEAVAARYLALDQTACAYHDVYEQLLARPRDKSVELKTAVPECTTPSFPTPRTSGPRAETK